MDNFTGRWDSD